MSRPETSSEPERMRLPTGVRRNLRLMRIAHILATHGMAALAVRLRLFGYPYVWLVQMVRGDELPKDLGAQIVGPACWDEPPAV